MRDRSRGLARLMRGAHFKLSHYPIFDPPTPVDVEVVLDSDKTVEALIPVEGGSITTTGADGTVYTLDVPSDALNNETVIGLTPVLNLTGMPFGGDQTYAVQFSPEGLHLQNFAVLTIAPAIEIPVDQQIFLWLPGGREGCDLCAPFGRIERDKDQRPAFQR